MSHTVQLKSCPKCGLPIPAEAPQGLCPKCVLLGAATATETGVAPTATSEIPTLERIASAFPQLEIIELIGRGGMGFVFKARQPHLDRFVALKLLPDKLANDARFAERFNREGRVLAKLNHPNIVSVFDFGQTGGFYYLLMEYIDGVNLRQAMRAGRFSPAEALSIVPRICEALQYAHEQGILHRDIKPENILLDAKGRVKIADFGIAKLVGEKQPSVSLTNTGAALGTPHYMAPEQLEKPTEVDHRADIYSLGVVFYEMLTGELPIGRFAAPSSKTPVGSSVDEVVFRTLEKDRERRFQSAGEMKTQVEHLGTGAQEPPVTGAARGTNNERAPVSRWAIYGAIGVGLSLPVPLLLIASMLVGRGGVGPSELWAALGSVALPGLGGLLLGWLGLNEIRETGGRTRGLPFALFATLTWPLLLFCGVTIGIPMVILNEPGSPTIVSLVGRVLVLLLPAGVIAFAMWTVHASARWASRQPVGQRRGVLKWVFIGVLGIGIGIMLVSSSGKMGLVPPDPLLEDEVIATVSPPPETVSHAIQFTVAAVGLHDDERGRWLSFDYTEQIRGACERGFKTDTRIPGFKHEVRTSARLLDTNPGFPAITRRRSEWRLPGSLTSEDAASLIKRLRMEWVDRPAVVALGEERTLFQFSLPDGGSYRAAICAVTPLAAEPPAPVAPAVEPPTVGEIEPRP